MPIYDSIKNTISYLLIKINLFYKKLKGKLMNKLNFTAVLLLNLAIMLNINKAYAFTTKAPYALLIDADTQAVLLEKNANIIMAPSSMSKLMTIYVTFDLLKKGALTLDKELIISEKAWKKMGSKMFLNLGSKVKLEDLIRGAIVASGNDACIAIAEGIAGSEAGFAQMMNEKSKEIGLENSRFANATGWPDDNHYMTAQDLARLSIKIIKEFPEYYHYFAERTFEYNKIKQDNRNLLLSKGIGVDGLKTGHTEVAGHGIVISAKQNGRRLILVINGLPTMAERAKESEDILNYGFANFSNVTIHKKGNIISQARVWMGEKKFVPVIASEDIVLTLAKEQIDKIKIELQYDSPIPAPITQGQYITDLSVNLPSGEKKIFGGIAGENISKLSYFSRLMAKAKYLIFG